MNKHIKNNEATDTDYFTNGICVVGTGGDGYEVMRRTDAPIWSDEAYKPIQHFASHEDAMDFAAHA